MRGGAPRWWQSRGFAAQALLPLAACYRLGFLAHRAWAQRHRRRFPVPVIVVGNLTAGGSGKTPVVEALARALRERGRRVAVVSRGYRSDVAARGGCERVSGCDPRRHGDEPTLLAQTTGVPVIVGRDRPHAIAHLLATEPHLDVILADDGLQHHRLARQFELVVLDPATLGNRWLLPAGPLREPLDRLRSVSAVLVRGAANDTEARATVRALLGRDAIPATWALTIEPVGLQPLAAWQQGRKGDAETLIPLSELAGRRVAAITGIAHPERFFVTLEALGATVARHPFPDHHRFHAHDLPKPEPGVWRLFTAKDAVKCAEWAVADDFVLVVRAQVPTELVDRIEETIDGSAASGRPGLPAV